MITGDHWVVGSACQWCKTDRLSCRGTTCLPHANLVVADPPWQFRDNLPGRTRGASRRYATMPWTDIANLRLPPISDDSVLMMWRVASMQREALDVARAWGFEVKSEIVWLKRTATGARHFGMGRHVRGEHEVCLIATRGSPSALVHNVRSTFPATVGEHSAKPDEFYRIAESLYPGPRLELFSRHERAGWTCIGNELANAVTLRPRRRRA